MASIEKPSMIKHGVLVGLVVVSLILIAMGDLRQMVSGLILGIAGLDIQAGFNTQIITKGIRGLEQDFEMLEARLKQYLDARLDEIGRRIRQG
jgi:hypothetical protein